MKRVLAMIAASALLAVALPAEVRRDDVPMDRVPWELAHPRLTKGVWWNAPHIPSDHPYWWTLTDELSPQELKERLAERHAAIRREAQSRLQDLKRVAGESSTEEQEVQLWFLSGSEDAKLFPMWSAFEAFTSSMVVHDEKDEREVKLKEFGLSAFAARQVVDFAAQADAESEELYRQAGREAQRLRKLKQEVASRLPAEQVRQMKVNEDVDFLASAAGVPVEELRTLVRRVHRDPFATTAVPALVALRAAIGEEQWQLFRRYLLEEVAPYKHVPLTYSLEE
jgi:hypothetical protein